MEKLTRRRDDPRDWVVVENNLDRPRRISALKTLGSGIGKVGWLTIKWAWIVLCWTLVMARIPIFLVMLWLRPPIAIVCQLIAGPSLFAFLFCWYAFPIPKMLWGIGALSFSAFVLLWVYDLILMFLSPMDMVREL